MLLLHKVILLFLQSRQQYERKRTGKKMWSKVKILMKKFAQMLSILMKEPSLRHLEEMSCLKKSKFEELSKFGQSFCWKIKIMATKRNFYWLEACNVCCVPVSTINLFYSIKSWSLLFQVNNVNICQTSVLVQTDCVLYEKTASSIIHIGIVDTNFYDDCFNAFD